MSEQEAEQEAKKLYDLACLQGANETEDFGKWKRFLDSYTAKQVEEAINAAKNRTYITGQVHGRYMIIKNLGVKSKSTNLLVKCLLCGKEMEKEPRGMATSHRGCAVKNGELEQARKDLGGEK